MYPGMLLHDDGLPYDMGRLLTPDGKKYAEASKNLERYWQMQVDNFKPKPFEGRLKAGNKAGEMVIELEVTAPSVTVVVVTTKAKARLGPASV